jgi:hypothetical protein
MVFCKVPWYWLIFYGQINKNQTELTKRGLEMYFGRLQASEPDVMFLVICYCASIFRVNLGYHEGVSSTLLKTALNKLPINPA